MAVQRFVAIDVETANQLLGSVCQIGLALFEDDKVIETYSTLINPQDVFDPFNVSIHGITEEDVRNAATFSESWPSALEFIGQHPVASYGHFDRSAIAQACEIAGHPVPSNTWINLHPVARRAWPEFAAKNGVRLARICKHLNISLEQHHDALVDAIAAGRVFAEAMATTGLDLGGWDHRLRQPIHPGSGAGRPANSFTANPEGLLYGEGVVFTGALSITREQAREMAASLGCTILNGVSKKTTLLVIGDQDIRLVGAKGKSSKHCKAEEMIEKGHPIRILSESDFQRLVGEA